MQEISILSETLTEIDFAPQTELKEIIQNVKTILTTMKYSVPLDRNFGIIAASIDEPIPLAKAKCSAEIVEAIQRYEPRAEIVRITFNGDGMDGILKPNVQIRIKND